MRVVVQKVSSASVEISGKTNGEISRGLCVLVAFTGNESEDVLRWMVNKLINLRIFPDENDKMNLSVTDVQGGILIISNFTLYGDARKGFRPSYTNSGGAEIAEPKYNRFVELIKETSLPIACGIFGAMMNVHIMNDGPVTLIIDKD